VLSAQPVGNSEPGTVAFEEKDHCDAAVVWRGRFRTRIEQIYRVDGCDDTQ